MRTLINLCLSSGIIFFIFITSVYSQGETAMVPAAWQTEAEKTDYKKTSTYDETVAYCKRLAGAWQGRLPQELRIRDITTQEEANRFLTRSYVAQFNKKFAVESAEPGLTAFVPCTRSDLDRVFSIQTERTVNRDNTVKFKNMFLQIDKQGWRSSMEGCRVTIYQHFDDTISIGFAHQHLGKFSADGTPIKSAAGKNDRFERKVRAPFVQNSQTGHIMC